MKSPAGDVPEDEFRVRLAVSNDLAGMVIGTGGEQIKYIQSMSNTQVKIGKKEDNGGYERVVTIKGTPDRVELAIIEIMTVQKDEDSASDFFFIDYSDKKGGKGGGKGADVDKGKGDKGKNLCFLKLQVRTDFF